MCEVRNEHLAVTEKLGMIETKSVYVSNEGMPTKFV